MEIENVSYTDGIENVSYTDGNRKCKLHWRKLKM